MKFELDIDNLTLDGKDMKLDDLMVLLTKYQIKHNDPLMEHVVDYFVMKYECGHNGFHLKQEYVLTNNPKECKYPEQHIPKPRGNHA